MSIKRILLVLNLVFTAVLVGTDAQPLFVLVPDEDEFAEELFMSERELARQQQREREEQENRDIEYLEGLNAQELLREYENNPHYRELIIQSILRHGIPSLSPLPENLHERIRVFSVLPALTREQRAAVLSQLTQADLARLSRMSPAHQNLFNTYRQNVTTLDLSRERRINRDFLEQMGETYPNVQRVIITAASTERPGYAGITPKLAQALVEAFPHLRFVQFLNCDFSQPLISGLSKLSMLKSGDAKIAVEYIQTCAQRAEI